MNTLLQDFRYAIRTLRANRGFAAVAVLTLALGIGGNTAIFSIVHSVLLQPLPYPQPEKLVYIVDRYQAPGGLIEAPLSAPELVELQQRKDIFRQVAGFEGVDLTLLGGTMPERIQGVMVSPSLFTMLGVQPALGRLLQEHEAQPGSDKVLMLTDGFWKRRFASNPDVLKQPMILNGEKYHVAGILPPDFRFRRTADVYIPLSFTAKELAPAERGSNHIQAMARLLDHDSQQQAARRIDALVREHLQSFPNTYPARGYDIELRPATEQMLRDVRPALLVLASAVAFVLLIACVNVTNLLLVRATARRREIAVRTALGANRSRLFRQLLTESVVIAVVGGLLGILLALWGVDTLKLIDAGRFLPRAAEVKVDGTVLLFTLGLSVFAGLLFGVIPAFQASQLDLSESLKEGGRGGSSGRARNRVNRALVVAEIGFALALLSGMGLMLRSLYELQNQNLGFRKESLLTARVALPESSYSEVRSQQFVQSALDRFRRLPGVEKAGATRVLPLTNSNEASSFEREEQPVKTNEIGPNADVRAVTPDYIQTMGIPIVRGRAIEERDTPTAEKVCVIDQKLAEQFWPNEDPIGKRISRDDRKTWETIVGVVGSIIANDPSKPRSGTLYEPMSQHPATRLVFTIRTQSDPVAMADLIRRELRSVDATQALYDVRTLEGRLADALEPRRYTAILLSIFAGVAIVLASIGIYGVMAYSVSQREHELGIRLALGARRSELTGMVVRQALAVAMAGVAFGLVLAFCTSRALHGLLFGVSVNDPWTFALVAVILLVVSTLASYIPALRAARIDPSDALRSQR